MSPTSYTPMAFHTSLTNLVQGVLNPKSIAANGTIVFSSDQCEELPPLVSLNSQRIDPDHIPGFPPSRQDHGLAEAGFRLEWAFLDKSVHKQPLQNLMDRCRSSLACEPKFLKRMTAVERGIAGRSSVGDLIRDASKMGISIVRDLAELLFFSGEFEYSNKSANGPACFVFYLASGLLFATQQDESNAMKAGNSLRLAARSMSQSSFIYMAPMLYDLIAQIDRAGTAHASVSSGIAARLWLADPANDKDPPSLRLRMFRAMWHAQAACDFSTFSEQNRHYAWHLVPGVLFSDAGWAMLRSAWALSERSLVNGRMSWKEVVEDLTKASRFFHNAKDWKLKARTDELVQVAKQQRGS